MKSSWKRETKETRIEVSLETDGLGARETETGIGLLDEMLCAFAVGANFDLAVKARATWRPETTIPPKTPGLLWARAWARS